MRQSIGRIVYSGLWAAALPIAFLRLLWRSRQSSKYRERMPERLGIFSAPAAIKNGIWIHTVSVGEFIAAQGLIGRLLLVYPNIPITVTTMTLTGSERVKAVLGDSVFHVYLPYDLPFAVHRFLNAIKPRLGIIIETELWPNLLTACESAGVPIILANARLSEKSYKGYARFKSFIQPMLCGLTCIAAQDAAGARRLIDLGARASTVHVTGNIKFDRENPKVDLLAGQTLRKLLLDSVGYSAGSANNRIPIWIFASTHPSEDEIALGVHQKIKASFPAAILILVPRHPERFDAVFKLSESFGFRTHRRSDQRVFNKPDVYLVDTMGDLMMCYAASDIAVVGGSFVSVGGHNVLEAAVFKKPIIQGPHYFNFAAIVEQLREAGALLIVQNEKDLWDNLENLIKQPSMAEQIGEAAYGVVQSNRGSLERLWDLVKSYL